MKGLMTAISLIEPVSATTEDMIHGPQAGSCQGKQQQQAHRGVALIGATVPEIYGAEAS
jgi:hypothetical protein